MSQKIEHEGVSEVVCPHCGHAHRDSWDMSDGECSCSQCDRPFEISSYVERVITTAKAYRCPACGLGVRRKADGSCGTHCVYGTWTVCPGGKAVER